MKSKIDVAVLGDRIVQRRNQMGMTQSELARCIGIARGQMWKYETGTSSPTADVLMKLSQALAISVDWLLGIEATEWQPEASVPPGELDETEREIVEVLRLKSPERRKAMLEIVRLAQ